MNIDWDAHLKNVIGDFNRKIMLGRMGMAEGGAVADPSGTVTPGKSVNGVWQNGTTSIGVPKPEGYFDRGFGPDLNNPFGRYDPNGPGVAKGSVDFNNPFGRYDGSPMSPPTPSFTNQRAMSRFIGHSMGFAEGGAPGIIPGPVVPGGGDNTMTPTQTGEYITPVDAIIAKGRELAPESQLSDQDAHAIGKLWFDQETSRLKQAAGNPTPPRNVGIAPQGIGYAEGGVSLPEDDFTQNMGLNPQYLDALPSPQGIQKDFVDKVAGPANPMGAELAKPATAPLAPKPDYNIPGISNAGKIGAYVQGGPQGTRALRADKDNQMQVSESLSPEQVTGLQGAWDKEPVNVAEAERVKNLPVGIPANVPVTSTGHGKTIQVVEPDAEGKMPGITIAGTGQNVIPGLSPQKFIEATQTGGGQAVQDVKNAEGMTIGRWITDTKTGKRTFHPTTGAEGAHNTKADWSKDGRLTRDMQWNPVTKAYDIPVNDWHTPQAEVSAEIRGNMIPGFQVIPGAFDENNTPIVLNRKGGIVSPAKNPKGVDVKGSQIDFTQGKAEAHQRGGSMAAQINAANDLYQSNLPELISLREKVQQKGLLPGSRLRDMNAVNQWLSMKTSDPDVAVLQGKVKLMADNLQKTIGGGQGGEWAFKVADALLDPALAPPAFEARMKGHGEDLARLAGSRRDFGRQPVAGKAQSGSIPKGAKSVTGPNGEKGYHLNGKTYTMDGKEVK